MTRTTSILSCGLLLAGSACSAEPPPAPVPVDCSVEDGYEFETISDFTRGRPMGSGWFQYADPTPGGVPNIDPTDPNSDDSNLPVTPIPSPGRCGDTDIVQLRAYGHNFYGAGFGDYEHNNMPADGTGYEGISFWARSPGDTDKTFMFYVDEGRTIVLPAPMSGNGGLSVATDADQDLDGDGYVGIGDIPSGHLCRIPVPQSVADPDCYAGGDETPSAATRVPEPGECGNQFHTYVTTTEHWQLFLIPWSQLVQWPCPNRLEDGISPADIRGFQIKFLQGTNYDVWLDDIQFYRRKDGGS